MFEFLEKTNVRLISFVLGALFLLDAIIATVTSDTGLGVMLTYLTAVVFLVGSSGEKFLTTKAVHLIKVALLAILCLLLIGGAILFIVGGDDTATLQEDTVIVLGTTVQGDQPTEALRMRLDAAVEYHKQNPGAQIIVTGGQGTDENDSEASVMAKYLQNAGVPETSIIKEDKATSTVENFAFAKAHLQAGHKVCFITNDFHIYRAGVLAEQAGIQNATHLHGNTPLAMVVPNCFRESIVVLKMWLID